jgi:hypothetical protein
MEDWNIQARHHFCTGCEAPFEDKAPCHTILSLVGAEFKREDLCPPCFEKAGGLSVKERPEVFSYWQGSYELTAPPPTDPLAKEDAEGLLRKMIERNDPAEKEARYILAVMLERKRILKHRETVKKESSVLVYEHIKSGEVFTIEDPNLKLTQLSEVQKRVAAMLKPSDQTTPPQEPAPVQSTQGENN